MAVAKERVPVTRSLERIPHKDVAYAFLEIEVTGTADEFQAYRKEALEKHPEYAFAASLAAIPKRAPAKKSVAAPDGDEASKASDESGEGVSPAAPPPAPTEAATPKSAADIARERILAKRGAK